MLEWLELDALGIETCAKALLAIELVFRVVAWEEDHRAIAFERQNVCAKSIQEPAVVADDGSRAYDMHTNVQCQYINASNTPSVAFAILRSVPANSEMAFSRLRSTSTSRSLLGSSSSSTLGACLIILAKCARLRSPPLSVEIGRSWSVPVKLKAAMKRRMSTSCVP